MARCFCRFWKRPSAPWSTCWRTVKGRLGHNAALMKVFLPYLTWNTLFDNTRATMEIGRKPVPFSQYSFPLLQVQPRAQF